MKYKYTYSEVREKSKSEFVCWSGFLLFHRVSTPLVWLLSNANFVKPNHITLASFSIRLTSAFYFYFATSTDMLIGALLYGASTILDDVDGGLARLKNMQSAFGAYLDPMLDLIGDYFCIVAICWGQFIISGNDNWMLIGSIILFFNMFTAIENLYMKQLREKEKEKEKGTVLSENEQSLGNKSPYLKKFVKEFQFKYRISLLSIDLSDIRVVIFVIAPAVGHLESIMFFGCALFVIKFVFDKVIQIIRRDYVLFN